jgi:hypothetical protein
MCLRLRRKLNHFEKSAAFRVLRERFWLYDDYFSIGGIPSQSDSTSIDHFDFDVENRGIVFLAALATCE